MSVLVIDVFEQFNESVPPVTVLPRATLATKPFQNNVISSWIVSETTFEDLLHNQPSVIQSQGQWCNFKVCIQTTRSLQNGSLIMSLKDVP